MDPALYRVFNKVLSKWQKLLRRWRRKKLVAKVQLASAEGSSLEKFWNLGFLKCISSILEQKFDCLNRTQASLNFGFFIQWQNMNTLFKLGNFQRKVSGEFTWNSQKISLATSSYWEPCYIQPFIQPPYFYDHIFSAQTCSLWSWSWGQN